MIDSEGIVAESDERCRLVRVLHLNSFRITFKKLTTQLRTINTQPSTSIHINKKRGRHVPSKYIQEASPTQPQPIYTIRFLRDVRKKKKKKKS